MTIRDMIEANAEEFTVSERKVASAILADYPFAGLLSIQELAGRTQVSAPSITRFIRKIGSNGYQDFQRALISELREGQWGPIQLKEIKGGGNGTFTLAGYAERVAQHVRDIAKRFSATQFETVCDLLSDRQRGVFLLGGRISDSLVSFLTRHLRQIRPDVHHIPANPELWPDFLMRMRKRDVVVLVDFRRYQANLREIARLISETRQSKIVLVTDPWLSPISRYSAHVLPIPIEIGTAWDSHAGTLTLLEAILVRVSEADWGATRKRIESLDAMRFALTDGPDDKGVAKRKKARM